jgi:lysozyme family protein
MKKYNIKYEDRLNNVEIVTVEAFSKQHAVSKLPDYKEIYWISEHDNIPWYLFCF